MREAGERALSTDARSGLQALARTPPPLPMGPGRAERRALAYLRRGTVPLSPNVAVAQGTVVAPSWGPPRPAEDFVTPMARTGASAPAGLRGHLVVDTLHMQPSAGLVHVGAEHEGLEDALGTKDKRGMLTSMATRAAFLSDPTHTMVFHSPPKHASWMPQIERWGSIVVRKFLKRASCTSGEDVQARVRAFIPYFNATMATPFQ